MKIRPCRSIEIKIMGMCGHGFGLINIMTSRDDLNRLPLAPAVTADGSIEVPLIDAARLTVRAENLFDARVEAKRTPVLAYAAPRLIYAGVTLTWPD